MLGFGVEEFVDFRVEGFMVIEALRLVNSGGVPRWPLDAETIVSGREPSKN